MPNSFLLTIIPGTSTCSTLSLQNQKIYDLFIKYLKITKVVLLPYLRDKEEARGFSLYTDYVIEEDRTSLRIRMNVEAGVHNVVGKFFLETGLECLLSPRDQREYNSIYKQPVDSSLSEDELEKRYARGVATINVPAPYLSATIPKTMIKELQEVGLNQIVQDSLEGAIPSLSPDLCELTLSYLDPKQDFHFSSTRLSFLNQGGTSLVSKLGAAAEYVASIFSKK